jgi:putative N6-adenine-specific DNA methylase
MLYRLFIIIPPGFERLALEELDSKCPVSTSEITKGGIEVEVDLDWIVRAHLLLKIPTRFLMRVTSFKVRDFPKLHKKLVALKWNEVLSHPEPEFEVSCSKSRLMHSTRIKETFKKALDESLMRQPLSLDWQKKNYPRQTFYVRLQEDTLTLSLDLSGDPLYKRGLQVIKGEAPLRENFAAAMILELFRDLEEEVVLVDPMCGSGTFLAEALNFHCPLHKRPFAFETAPFFKGKLVRNPSQTLKLPIKKALGFDINQELISKINLGPEVKLNNLDAVKTPLKIEENFVMICNPPYGERLKVQGKRGKFLQDAWEKFLNTDCPLRLGWVVPSDMADLFSSPKGYLLRKKLPFRNGGLPVTYFVWEKKT